MNLAFARTRGGPDDVIAILNPDLHFLPGSVETLLEYVLTNRRCGAVDPRAFMDPGGTINLPRNLLPTLLDHAYVALAQMSVRVCRAYARRRFRLTLPWWTAEGPIQTDMLSGCCLFVRRGVLDERSPPMDERYPLYYEDTDFFRTLKGRGYGIVHHGGARVIHYWSRSAGAGSELEPMRRYWISQRAYFRKFYGPWGEAFTRATRRLVDRWPARLTARPIHDYDVLGGQAEPFEIEVPVEGRFVVEFAAAPTFVLAAGIMAQGPRWRFPQETWDWVPEMQVFLRALEYPSGRFLRAWSFMKVGPPRQRALAPEEGEQSAVHLMRGSA
jgi:hypothetical protein